MPLQVFNWPRPTQGDINPFQTGFNSSLNTFMGLAAGYSDLLSKALERKKLEAELPYASDIAKAGAAYKLAMAKYLTSPNQMLKGVSSLGKTFLEPPVINQLLNQTGSQGNLGTQNPEADESAFPNSEIQNAYELNRQKSISDSDTRKKNLFATNIEKTLQTIDPKVLTQYSGISGGLQKNQQKLLAGFGQESPEYDDYVNNVKRAQLLAKQVRQFYGDSIQPIMEEKLNKMANPSEWFSNPKLAKQNFDSFSSLLGKELSTYRGALKSRKTYEEIPENPYKEGLTIPTDKETLGKLGNALNKKVKEQVIKWKLVNGKLERE